MPKELNPHRYWFCRSCGWTLAMADRDSGKVDESLYCEKCSSKLTSQDNTWIREQEKDAKQEDELAHG